MTWDTPLRLIGAALMGAPVLLVGLFGWWLYRDRKIGGAHARATSERSQKPVR